MHLKPFCTCVLPGSLHGHSHRVKTLIFRISPSRQCLNMSYGTSSPKKLDLVAQSAAELQGLFSSGALTSTQLVEACLAQIERHDRQGMNLRAMIAVAPKSKLLDMAKELDTERENNSLRGPFHGLPIIVKVYLESFSVIGSSLITRVGYIQYRSRSGHGDYIRVFCFARCEAQQASFGRSEGCSPQTISPRVPLTLGWLVEQGLIILGKANLSVSVLPLIGFSTPVTYSLGIWGSQVSLSLRPAGWTSDTSFASPIGRIGSASDH